MNPTTSPRSHDEPLPARATLVAAWTAFLFLYVYVDILGFYLPGVVEDILAGVVWEFSITQTWATGALLLMAVPISMVLLSATLPARASRTANLVVAPLYALVSAFNVLGEPWVVFFGSAVVLELVVLAVIVRVAWRWPRSATAPVGRSSEAPAHR